MWSFHRCIKCWYPPGKIEKITLLHRCLVIGSQVGRCSMRFALDHDDGLSEFLLV